MLSRHCAYLVVDEVNPAVLDRPVHPGSSPATQPYSENSRKRSVLYRISSSRNRLPISLPPRRNGSRSDNHGKAQAGCSGFVLGVRRRTGTDPSERWQQYGTENLSAYLRKMAAGWLCGASWNCRS